MSRHARSHFSALTTDEKRKTREAANTLAQQGLRSNAPSPMRDLDQADIPNGRAGHEGQTGAPAGTQNGKGMGTSRGDGVELMAKTIVNRMNGGGGAPNDPGRHGGGASNRPSRKRRRSGR